MSTQTEQPKVAVVIPAKNEADIIATTVRTCKAIPKVDLIVVVDDGSTDETSQAARRASDAVVVRHSVSHGKASAMETGAKVVAMREPVEGPERLLLFLDADLGESAAETAPLVEAVLAGKTDCAIAALPPQKGAGGMGIVRRTGFQAIRHATGWEPTQPLSGQRCLTRKAYDDIQPLAVGWGVEVGMTIDLLVSGYRVQEIPCELTHRVSGADLAGQWHRFTQWLGVLRAVARHIFTGNKVSAAVRREAAAKAVDYQPYQLQL